MGSAMEMMLQKLSLMSGGTDFDAIQDRLVEEAERLAEEARRRKAGQRVPRTEDKFQPFNVKEYSADGQLEQIDLPPSPNRYWQGQPFANAWCR